MFYVYMLRTFYVRLNISKSGYVTAGPSLPTNRLSKLKDSLQLTQNKIKSNIRDETHFLVVYYKNWSKNTHGNVWCYQHALSHPLSMKKTRYHILKNTNKFDN